MIRCLILILMILNCKSLDKEDWRRKVDVKDKIRFQIPVFEIAEVSREDRIRISQEFADAWTQISGYTAIVLDEKIKSDLLEKNRQIPSSNFSIQSKFSEGLLQLLIVDLETGEILSYGKTKLSVEKDLTIQFEEIIVEQLLRSN
jgi:hypothetical protein